MPKKFKGENTKATAARERKAATRQASEDKKRREEEDAYWQDDDKHAARKQERKAQREQKKQEQSERKEASKLLLLEEEESQPKSKAGGATKTTRAEIAAAQKRDSGATATALPKGVTEGPLVEENPNQLLRERQLEGEEEARTVEEAITLLSVGKEPSEKHPERRLKAAYAVFEERELPRLKAENPNLRMSQLKQILRKDWMKSPENPLNQHFVAYNEKT